MSLDSLPPEEKERLIEEYLIILLGVVDRPIPTMLHLEKEFFILYRIVPKLSKIVSFRKHYYGPYSDELKEALENPLEYEDVFDFSFNKVQILKNNIKTMAKNISLTPEGKKLFKMLKEKYKDKKKFQALLAIAKSIRELYDDLTPEELLLLIYVTYPEYVEKSIIAEILLSPKERKRIADGLFRKGKITEEKYYEIIRGDFNVK